MLTALVAVILAACAARVPAPISERELATEVRRQAQSKPSPVEVYALSDPAGLNLLAQAQQAEQAGRLDEATRFVRQALEITPRNPEYWQYLAELELQSGDFAAAIEYAERSFALGPQIGRLCYRNWLTQKHAHERLGDSTNSARANQQAERCLPVSVRSG